MHGQDLNALIHKNDKGAIKEVFEKYYGKMGAIAIRYCKNKNQANDAINFGFNSFFYHIF